MKRTSNRFFLLVAISLAITQTGHAGIGIWSNATSSSLWSALDNWLLRQVADGSGYTAYFDNRDITADNTVHLDGDRTLANLVFGDPDPSTAFGWILDNNGNSGNILTLAGTLPAIPTITVNTLGTGKSATISATIAGSAGLNKAGAGILALTAAANTYSGLTTISAGIVKVTVGSSLGTTGPNNGTTVAAGAEVLFDSGSSTGEAFTIYGGHANGPLFFNVANIALSGAITLGSDSTITGKQNTMLGTINLGSRTLTVAKDAGQTTESWSARISGTGGLIVEQEAGAASTLTLTGVNTYTGPTTVNLGILKAGVASVADTSGAFGNNSAVTLANAAGASMNITGINTQIGSLSGGGTNGGNVTLGSATLTVGGDSTNPAYAGVISGAGGKLTKSGTGRLTLSGTNTYSGVTTVTGGTLALSGTGSIANTPEISLASGAILDVSSVTFSLASTQTISGLGTVTGDLTCHGQITPGNTASIGTLNVDDRLTLNGGKLNVNIAGASSSDLLQLNGGTVSVPSASTIQLSGVTVPGTYLVIAGASGTIPTGNLTVLTGNADFVATLDNSVAGQLRLGVSYKVGDHLVWNGTPGNSVWDVGISTNWLNSGSASVAFADLDVVAFNGMATGKTVLLDSPVSPTAVSVSGADDYTIGGGGSGSITGHATLTKQGAGTLTLSTVNTYTGLTTIEGGTVKLGAANASPGDTTGDTTVLTGATLDVDAAGSVAEPLVISGNGFDANGALQNTSATVTNLLAGPITLAGNAAIGVTTTVMQIDGIISETGGARSLTKLGAGILVLTNANTYTGNTNVAAGGLILAQGAQLKFVIGAGSGSNNRISGDGILSLDGNFNIDTSAADATSLTHGTWLLENVASFSGAYGTTFTVVSPFADAGNDTWTKTVGDKVWTFDETTGTLTLVSTNPASYTTWIDGFFPGVTDPAIIGATVDPDQDGLDNAAEMVLGGNPATVMDAALAPAGVRVTTDLGFGAGPTDYLKFTYRRSDQSVAAGVTSGVEFNNNLAPAWTSAVDGELGVEVLEFNDFFDATPGSAMDKVEVYIPCGSQPTLFARLAVHVP
jgi:autotransporter-associated beta strand protein